MQFRQKHAQRPRALRAVLLRAGEPRPFSCGWNALQSQAGRLGHVPSQAQPSACLLVSAQLVTEDIRAPESKVFPGIWGALAGMPAPVARRGFHGRSLCVATRTAGSATLLLPVANHRETSARKPEAPRYPLAGAGPEVSSRPGACADSQGSSRWMGTRREQAPTRSAWAGQEAEIVKRGYIPFSFFKIRL